MASHGMPVLREHLIYQIGNTEPNGRFQIWARLHVLKESISVVCLANQINSIKISVTKLSPSTSMLHLSVLIA